jgi:hypothetical protein
VFPVNSKEIEASFSSFFQYSHVILCKAPKSCISRQIPAKSKENEFAQRYVGVDSQYLGFIRQYLAELMPNLNVFDTLPTWQSGVNSFPGLRGTGLAYKRHLLPLNTCLGDKSCRRLSLITIRFIQALNAI